jgi:hypothetical protein
MAEPVSALLRRSLHRLASDVPDSYRRIARELGPLVVVVDVDGETFGVLACGEVVVIDGDRADAAVRISTSRRAVLDVLDAATTLSEAVESDRVSVRGQLDDVLRAHDAMIAYTHAAVRAPAAGGLLAALRDGAGR